MIGDAMGKPIAGGQEIFWEALRDAGLAEAPQTAQGVETKDPVEAADDEQDFDALGDAAYGDAAYEEALAADDD